MKSRSPGFGRHTCCVSVARRQPTPRPSRATTSTTTPASAVPNVAVTGAIIAATGIVVGSLPVSIVGAKMLTSVATVHNAIVAPDNANHTGRRATSPRRRENETSDATEAPTPQIQVLNAATGRCWCSLPDTRSGEKTLISTTAAQIEAIVAMVHAVHESSTPTVGDPLGGGHTARWGGVVVEMGAVEMGAVRIGMHPTITLDGDPVIGLRSDPPIRPPSDPARARRGG